MKLERRGGEMAGKHVYGKNFRWPVRGGLGGECWGGRSTSEDYVGGDKTTHTRSSGSFVNSGGGARKGKGGEKIRWMSEEYHPQKRSDKRNQGVVKKKHKKIPGSVRNGK